MQTGHRRFSALSIGAFAGGALAGMMAGRLLPPFLAQASGTAQARLGRDPFDALIADHRHFVALLRSMEDSSTHPANRVQLLLRLKRRLTAHALAEEDIIYPMLHDQANAGHDGAGQTSTGQTSTGQTSTGQTSTGQASTGQTSPGQTSASQAGSGSAGLAGSSKSQAGAQARRSDAEDSARQLYAEHAEIKMHLHALEEMPKDDPRWAARAGELRQLLEEHARHEEEVDFPKLRRSLDEDGMARLSRLIHREKSMVL